MVESTHSATDHSVIIAAAGFYIGTGVPSNGLGADGEFYFRRDGTLLASLIYHKASGVWVSIAVV